MRKSGICFCGAPLSDRNRIDTKYVRCSSCGEKVQMYVRVTRGYRIEFITSSATNRGVFHQILKKTHLYDVVLTQVPDRNTATRVEGSVEYKNIRGNWPQDIRRKVAMALTRAGAPTTKEQIHVLREWTT